MTTSNFRKQSFAINTYRQNLAINFRK